MIWSMRALRIQQLPIYIEMFTTNVIKQNRYKLMTIMAPHMYISTHPLAQRNLKDM